MARWFVLMAAQGAGAKAVRALQASGFDAYQPCETRWRHSRANKFRHTVPMLGGYLFAKFEDADHAEYQAREAEHIVGIVGSAGVPRAVPDDGWIEGLRAAETRGEFDHTISKRITFRPGQPVQIIGGSWKGVMAEIITAKDGEKRARIMLKAMGGGVMSLDVAHLAAA